MKKRPAAKKAAARKPAAKKSSSKPKAKTAARNKPASRSAGSSSSTRGQDSGHKYTPAPLTTDGSPAFRYPPQ